VVEAGVQIPKAYLERGHPTGTASAKRGKPAFIYPPTQSNLRRNGAPRSRSGNIAGSALVLKRCLLDPYITPKSSREIGWSSGMLSPR
jgi:hypothetical protein